MTNSFFNDEQKRAILTGNYYCPECNERMEWESENEDILICPKCGYSIDSELYGRENETYDDLYPTEEEVLARENQ